MKTLLACLLSLALAAAHAAENPLATAMVGGGQPWEYGDTVFLINDAWDAPGGAWNWCWRLRDALVQARPELDLKVEVNGIGDPRVLVDHLVSNVIPREPVLVVICSGNVAAAAKTENQVGVEPFTKALGDAIAKLREAKIEVVVLGPSPVSDTPDAKTPQDELSAKLAEAAANTVRAGEAAYVDMRSLCLERLKKDPPAAGKTILTAGESKYANPWHELAVAQAAKAIGERMAQLPLRIDVADSPLIDTLTVDLPLKRLRKGAEVEIRYTLDGKDPAKSGRKYEKPFPVTSTCTLNVIATDKGTGQSATAKAVFTKTKAKAGETLSRRALGLEWGLYVGKWTGLPDFATLKPETTGTWFSAEANPHRLSASHGSLRENIGVLFVGWIDIPVEGVYQFATVSDDGSRMWIDDELVVDNDGGHGMRLRSGRAALREGLHKVRLGWYNGTGGSGLEVYWQSEQIRRGRVPDSAWFHNPAKPHNFQPPPEKPADKKPADKKK